MVGDHSGCTGLPSRGAHLAVLIDILEGLNHTDNLVDVASDWEVIDAHLADSTIRSNDEGASKGDSCIISILDKDSVVL